MEKEIILSSMQIEKQSNNDSLGVLTSSVYRLFQALHIKISFFLKFLVILSFKKFIM